MHKLSFWVGNYPKMVGPVDLLEVFLDASISLRGVIDEWPCNGKVLPCNSLK